MEMISNTTCTKCQCCGEWTNYADDAHHKEREARIAELERAVMRARLELLEGECEPTDNAVEILSAALGEKEE